MAATLALHTEALEIFRELSDLAHAAQALSDLAFHAIDSSDLPARKPCSMKRRPLTDKLDAPRVSAHVKHVRGVNGRGRKVISNGLHIGRGKPRALSRSADTWQCIIVSWGVAWDATTSSVSKSRGSFHSMPPGRSRSRESVGYLLSAPRRCVLALAQGQYERAAPAVRCERRATRGAAYPLQSTDHPALARHSLRRRIFYRTEDRCGRGMRGGRFKLDAAVALGVGDRRDIRL